MTYSKQNPKIISYDWADIASGRGYVEFDLGELDEGKQLMGQQTPATVGKLYSSARNQAVDEDFDFEIQDPITFQGVTYIVVPIYFNNQVAGATTITSTVTIKIRHWDGTTETELANGTVGVSQALNAFNESRYQTHSFGITLPRTTFCKDETLRITITATSTASADKVLYIYRDPANRSVAVTVPAENMYTTRLTAKMPVVNE